MTTTDPISEFNRALDFAGKQLRRLVERHADYFPMVTSSGRWHHDGEFWTDWCGGFLAGLLWLFYERTGDSWWRDYAEHYSELLRPRRSDREVHDLGFIFLNSYGRWYELTGDESRLEVVAEAGATLAQRFQPKGQYIASFMGPHSLFIDIMMNVPIIFTTAAWLERNPVFSEKKAGFWQRAVATQPHDRRPRHEARPAAEQLRQLAVQHCLTSQRTLVRPDGSTAHEAVFDTTTGEFLRQSTRQGMRADSCWSRGLAWALYGFGLAYRHSGERQFLDTAQQCAAYYLEHVPQGGVPYWDFQDQQEIWDSSAAAIAACGLLLLEELSSTTATGQPAGYRDAALDILTTLCSDRFLAASTEGWEGILLHGVYHKHKNLGVDESVIWGDHFFVEALTAALK